MTCAIDEGQVWPSTESTNIQQYSNFKYDKPCNYILSKKKLGDGSYSSVFECKNKITGMHYAAKQYKKRLVFGLETMLQNEFQVLKQVSNAHPNVLTLIDYFETCDSLYLVTDLASGGELFDRIANHPDSKLPEEQAISITKILVSTIRYLHSNKIVHRDLKAENLLFQLKNSKNTSILVADFGCARILQNNNDTLKDICGTLSYLAPEMLSSQAKYAGHSFPVDMWALGVIVYFMLCGYMPFDCETDDETKQAILNGDYLFEPPEYWNHISQDAKDFINRCLVVDPKRRLTADAAELHPFINDLPSLEVSSPINRLLSSSSLKRIGSSNLSLTSKLKESVFKLQQQQLQQQLHKDNQSFLQPTPLLSPRNANHKRSLLPNRNDFYNNNLSSLLEKSRAKSISEDCTLEGDRCVSPDLCSRFTTPTSSTTVSRQHLFNDMLDLNPKKSTLKTNSNTNLTEFFL